MEQVGPLNLSSLKCVTVRYKDGMLNVPVFLIDAFNLIHLNLKAEGLFRKSGNSQRIKSMKYPFYGDFGVPEGATVFDICDLIKQFFREIEEPILTSALEPQFLRFHVVQHDATRILYVLELCHVLPPRHRETLAYCMRELKNVTKFATHNKMDAKNLSVVFAPSMFRKTSASDEQQLTAINPQASIEYMQRQKRENDLKAELLQILIEHAENICVLTEFEKVMSPNMYDNLLPEDRSKEDRNRNIKSRAIRVNASQSHPCTPVTSRRVTSMSTKRKSPSVENVDQICTIVQTKEVSSQIDQDPTNHKKDVRQDFTEVQSVEYFFPKNPKNDEDIQPLFTEDCSIDITPKLVDHPKSAEKRRRCIVNSHLTVAPPAEVSIAESEEETLASIRGKQTSSKLFFMRADSIKKSTRRRQSGAESRRKSYLVEKKQVKQTNRNLSIDTVVSDVVNLVLSPVSNDVKQAEADKVVAEGFSPVSAPPVLENAKGATQGEPRGQSLLHSQSENAVSIKTPKPRAVNVLRQRPNTTPRKKIRRMAMISGKGRRPRTNVLSPYRKTTKEEIRKLTPKEQPSVVGNSEFFSLPENFEPLMTPTKMGFENSEARREMILQQTENTESNLIDVTADPKVNGLKMMDRDDHTSSSLNRPSVAFIRENRRGHVRQNVAKFEKFEEFHYH